jgi:hypothetical protein
MGADEEGRLSLGNQALQNSGVRPKVILHSLPGASLNIWTRSSLGKAFGWLNGNAASIGTLGRIDPEQSAASH